MGHRLIRWVGDPSPWSDPNIAKALANGQIPLHIAERLAFFQKWQRQVIIPGTSSRIIGIESGFDQSYVWGPQRFLAWMTDADWERLAANRWERWQFIEVQPEWPPELMERPRMSKEHWMMLLDDFALLGPGRIAGSRLSAKQLAKDHRRRVEIERAAQEAEKLMELAEAQNSSRIHVVR